MKHGVLLLDKPKGMTSHQLVCKVRRLLKQKAVGHAGTLDPMATGLMVILLGKACKLSSYLMNGDKTYYLQFILGKETDTLDLDGRVLNLKPVQVTKSEIQEVIESSTGSLILKAPAFSAIKVRGQKLYQYARAGLKEPVVKKKMYFYNLRQLRIEKDHISLLLSCHKGGYIRSWVDWIGKRLGCGACLSGLQRVASAPYHLDQICPLDVLESGTKLESLHGFIPFDECLPYLQTATVNPEDERRFSHGCISTSLCLQLRDYQKEVDQQRETSRPIRLISSQNKKFLGIIELRSFNNPKVRNVFTEL